MEDQLFALFEDLTVLSINDINAVKFHDRKKLFFEQCATFVALIVNRKNLLSEITYETEKIEAIWSKPHNQLTKEDYDEAEWFFCQREFFAKRELERCENKISIIKSKHN